MRIEGVGTTPKGITGIQNVQRSDQKEGKTFAQTLADALQEVNQMQLDAEKAALQLATGQAELHQVMLTAEKANISLQLTLAIRNKLLEAYNEIMRMQV